MAFYEPKPRPGEIDRLLTFYNQVLGLGYVPVSLEPNPISKDCVEYTFMRIPGECWHAPPIVGVPRVKVHGSPYSK